MITYVVIGIAVFAVIAAVPAAIVMGVLMFKKKPALPPVIAQPVRDYVPASTVEYLPTAPISIRDQMVHEKVQVLSKKLYQLYEDQYESEAVAEAKKLLG